MPSPARSFVALAVLALGAAGAWAVRSRSSADTPAGAGEPAAAVAERAAPAPGTAAALGVTNAREPLPGLVTGGQPTPEQLDALARAGYARFVSLRPAGERGAGWEEEHVAGRDLAFERIPVAGAGDLTREAVMALDRLIDEAGGEPTVVYCASSNRVGALLALRAHWLEGASPEEALELGRAAGLAGLEGAVAALMEDGRR